MPIPKAKSVRLGRPPGGFTQHKRLGKLRELLEAHAAGVTIADIAGALRITTRSVRRYLAYLQRTTELESIETAPGGAHLWRIKPSERGRTLTLRRTQAYGLLAARRVFDVIKGSALFDELDVVTRQLVQIARRPTKGDIEFDTRLEDRLLYVPDVVRSYGHKGEEFDDIFRAVADLRVLSFRYKARGPEGRMERVTLHPYAILVFRGTVHCVGRDVVRQETRVFLLDAMSETRASEADRFALPDDFDVGEFLQGEFGIGLEGGEKVRVLLEFDPHAGEDVRTRRVHPSQKIATAPDGRVRLSMTVGNLEAVAAWVLGFGATARVIEPPELRDAVVRALRQTLGRYGVVA
jgi:predicted DNA-binding transcriptional regulator YafY